MVYRMQLTYDETVDTLDVLYILLDQLMDIQYHQEYLELVILTR